MNDGPGLGDEGTGGDEVALGGDQSDPVAVPWHFKLMVALVAVYVGWRIVQMIGWGIGWLADRL